MRSLVLRSTFVLAAVVGLAGCGRTHAGQGPARRNAAFTTDPRARLAGLPLRARFFIRTDATAHDGDVSDAVEAADGRATDAAHAVEALGTVPRLATTTTAERAQMGPGEEVAQAINPLMDRLRHCYESPAGAAITPANRSISMTVDVRGRVVSGGGGAGAPASVNACILPILQTLQLTPRPGGNHWFGFPLAPPSPVPAPHAAH